MKNKLRKSFNGDCSKETTGVDGKAVSGRFMSKKNVISLGLILVISGVIVYNGGEVVSRVIALYPNEVLKNPYFQLRSAWLLYVLLPIVVMSSLTLFFLPGVFLVMAMGKIFHWAEMMVPAFGTSFIVYVILISMVKLVSPVPPGPSAFLIAAITVGILSWSILAYRVSKGAKLPWPISQRKDLRHLLWTVAIPVIVLMLLLPILFWQDMHDDGFEALEIGRSLSTYFLPHFPTPSGLSGLGGGMFPMAYPIHWFVTVFGDFECSARLPILFYLPVLFCLLVQLIEWKSPRRLGCIEEVLLVLFLGIYTVTMSFNASFDPYFADIAAPAAFETLTVACMLATIYFLWRGQTVWFLFFAFMSFLCRPTGLLVLGLLGIAIVFCLPEQRKSWLKRISLVIGLCVLLSIVYEKIYIPSVIGDAGFGLSSNSLIHRFRYLRVDDLSRIKYVLFPCGIIPLISLFMFRWQDSLARVITILSISYFVFFYFQAFIALHHFVPVMVLPIVVFWRIYLHHQRWFRQVGLPVVALTSIVALWLSLPQHFNINRTVRAIGQKTSFLVGDYDSDYRTQVRHAELMFKLIPPDWEVKDPKSELVSGYGSCIYYSTRPKPFNTQINYVVQLLGEPGPNDFTRIADDGVAAIYVKDLQQWYRDLHSPPRTVYRSSLYAIPRTTLFRHWGEPQGNYSIDLKPSSLIKSLYGFLGK